VKVVCADAPVEERASAANSEATKRVLDIMTFMKARTKIRGSKAPHPTRRGKREDVTKPRERMKQSSSRYFFGHQSALALERRLPRFSLITRYSPYLPAAGL
jgi:hypothetical protein